MSISLRRSGLIVVALLVALAPLSFANGQKEAGSTQAAPAAGGKIYIPVICKGFQHQFWQTVKKGAEAAAAQAGATITFEGPPSEADIQPQVQMLANDMAKNPSAICLAALDTNSVMDQLNQAIQRHIPIIGFDSGVPNAPKGAIFATAATNSYAAAGLAADKMFAALKDKISAASDSSPVTIIECQQDVTSQSITDRGKGFRDEMIKLITTQTSHPKADIRVEGNPAYIAPDSPTTGKAIVISMVVPASAKDPDVAAAVQAMLARVKSNNIIGVFCSNEGTVKGMITSTNDGSALPTQYPGLVVVGFDAGKLQKQAIRSKYFLGSITQDPYNIGFQAVTLAVKAVKGQPVDNVDTGAKFYDSTNIDNPDIAQLVYD